MTADYEPDLYDLATPASFAGDVDWYRRKARECGGPVLELGAGTGRVTLALAEQGVVVYALERDERMLSALRQKLVDGPEAVRERVVPVQGDMRTFRLETRFPLVIAPFRVLLHNLTEDDHLACFQRVREHLNPSGRFAFNVFHPSLEFMANHVGTLAGVWRWVGTFPRDDGSCVLRSEANRYDTVRRRVHSQHRYDDYGADGMLRRTFLQRLELSYLYPADIERLLARAGFHGIHIAGGFHGRPLEKDTDELVVEARSEKSRSGL
jgi:SAM-dependent methyltransferase